MMDRTTIEVQQGLQAYYTSVIGEARSSVAQVAFLGSGFEADVFAFTLETETANATQTRTLILRLYAGEGAVEKSAREFAVMERLWAAGYPVPQVLSLEWQRSPFDCPFVIMERIHGVSLGEAYWAGSLEQQQEALALLYQLIARLHALGGSTLLPSSPLQASRDPYAFIDDDLTFLETLRQRLTARNALVLQSALSWLHSKRATVPCERLALVHGDFHPSNVLLRSDGAPYVIDWSNARLADPRTDLAWTRLITSADALPGGGEMHRRLYEQYAGAKVTNLAYFDVLACTRLLLSVLISLQSGAAQQGMRPEAEELMRRSATHTRYVAAQLQQYTGIPMPALEDTLAALFG
jgi:aminoglycoside phosphotransferase (APT) family kinase protein